MKPKVSEIKIDQLVPDNLNANKGTEYGKHLMDKSFRQFGAGRSILLDKYGRIVAGNKSVEQCAEIGIDNVIVVETDGTKLVAVKRIDIDLDTKTGRELAISDNSTSKANLEWDQNAIQQIRENWDVDLDDWGVMLPELKFKDPEDEAKKEISTKLIVECGEVMKLSELFSELQARGFTCKLKE